MASTAGLLFLLVISTINVYAQTLSAVCLFTETTLQGSVGMLSLAGGGTAFNVSVQGSAFIANEMNLRVHTYSAQFGCGDGPGPVLYNLAGVPDSAGNSAFVDTNVDLYGTNSIAGKSIVISNSTTPVACCSIIIISGNYSLNPPTPALTGLSATCRFNPAGMITGTIKFEEYTIAGTNYPTGTKITVSTSGTYTSQPVMNLFRYESTTACPQPNNTIYASSADGWNPFVAGPPSVFFSIGYLQAKHGQSLTYYDQAVRLSGPFSVLSRSIMVVSTDLATAGQVLGCCNIYLDTPGADPAPATNTVKRKQALCQIQDLADLNSMTGYFLLDTPSRTSQVGCDIYRAGISFLKVGDLVSTHQWWISEVGGTRPFCPANGTIYTPTDFWGPDITAPMAVKFPSSRTGAIGVGDMVGKYGLINGATITNAVNTDSQVQLEGPFSVMGRGIAVLLSDNSVSCCTIVEIPPGLINTTGVVNFGAAGQLNLVSLLAYYGSSPSFIGTAPAMFGIHEGGCSSPLYLGANGDWPYGGKFPYTGNASYVAIGGASSVAGRAVSIYDSTGTETACSESGVQHYNNIYSGLPPKPVYSGQEATCIVNNARMMIRFTIRQLYEPAYMPQNDPTNYQTGSEIQAEGFGTFDNLMYYQIVSQDCQTTFPATHFNPGDGLNFTSGGVSFGVGELSNKHGPLNSTSTGGKSFSIRYNDGSVRLFGPNSVMSKWISVQYANGTAAGCCGPIRANANNLAFPAELSTPTVPARNASATFTGAINGSITFSQDTTGLTTISSTGLSFSSPSFQTGDHLYFIANFYNSPSSIASMVYSPTDFIGPDANGIKWSSLLTAKTMPVGDLSGKHGPLKHNTPFSYVDPQVRLSGLLSILGRVIVVYDATGATEIARAPIGFVFTPTPTPTPTPSPTPTVVVIPTDTPTPTPGVTPTPTPIAPGTTPTPSPTPTPTPGVTPTPTPGVTPTPTPGVTPTPAPGTTPTPAAPGTTPTPTVPGVPTPDANNNSQGGGLKGWEIALIVLGALLGLAILVAAAVFLLAKPAVPERL